jgi:hypothetical protein
MVEQDEDDRAPPRGDRHHDDLLHPVSNEAAVQPAAHIEEARTIELITIRGRLD